MPSLTVRITEITTKENGQVCIKVDNEAIPTICRQPDWYVQTGTRNQRKASNLVVGDVVYITINLAARMPND